MKHFKSASLLGVLALLIASTANAQVPVYHPGQTIKLSITFAGPDADKITQAVMNWDTTIPLAPTQPGFSRQMYSGDSHQTVPKTFEVSFSIPENQANGEYSLHEIRGAISGNAPVVLFYSSPAEFPLQTVRIDNPHTLNKPTIKDVKELP